MVGEARDVFVGRYRLRALAPRTAPDACRQLLRPVLPPDLGRRLVEEDGRHTRPLRQRPIGRLGGDRDLAKRDLAVTEGVGHALRGEAVPRRELPERRQLGVVARVAAREQGLPNGLRVRFDRRPAIGPGLDDRPVVRQERIDDLALLGRELSLQRRAGGERDDSPADLGSAVFPEEPGGRVRCVDRGIFLLGSVAAAATDTHGSLVKPSQAFQQQIGEPDSWHGRERGDEVFAWKMISTVNIADSAPSTGPCIVEFILVEDNRITFSLSIQRGGPDHLIRRAVIILRRSVRKSELVEDALISLCEVGRDHDRLVRSDLAALDDLADQQDMGRLPPTAVRRLHT